MMCRTDVSQSPPPLPPAGPAPLRGVVGEGLPAGLDGQARVPGLRSARRAAQEAPAGGAAALSREELLREELDRALQRIGALRAIMAGCESCDGKARAST